MTIYASGRFVIPSVPFVGICVTPIRENASQSMVVNVSSCCVQKITPCIAQGAAKTFNFVDAPTVDYSGCSEITFDVWTKRPGPSATNVLSVSLTGGDITLPNDYTFGFSIDNATSAAIPAGKLYCEAWVTVSAGERRLVGAGSFDVIDTRKYDA